MSLLCLVWDRTGRASLSREPASFTRSFPSSFERDLRLRPPSLAGSAALEGAPEEAVGAAVPPPTAARPATAVSLFLGRHAAAGGSGPWGEAAPPASLPHPLALVKSSLQKAIRRGLARQAVAAAAYLLAHEPRELLRRLPVVLCEDVGIFDDLPELTWLMVAVQSGYVLSEEDVGFVLRLVGAAALHPQRTSPPKLLPGAAEVALARLLPRPAPATLAQKQAAPAPSAEKPAETAEAAASAGRTELLARCLALRACYGGMGGDVHLLLSFAASPELWADRLAPPSAGSPQASALAQEWLAVARGGGLGPRAWAWPLELAVQLEAAVDFHCSDVVPRLLRFLRSRPGATSVPEEAELKAAMWQHRSSLNCRDPPRPPTSAPAWWDAAGDAELSRLSRAAWAERRPQPPAAGVTAGAGADGKRRKTAGAGGGARQLSILRFAGPGAADATAGAAGA
uniref:Uncharacterized protein n=1 Tax=Alexandrium catenella TaxID=2925 RepID=A0A7S1WBT6_ALECA|mmetsp:Transcript_4820/g.12965  ORF Transcript_4820/g.12965 Transcript_4820/m.12965 type:complete len:455 (+) Transcript_4820:69-1433(+)